jgi:hypothetical protein
LIVPSQLVAQDPEPPQRTLLSYLPYIEEQYQVRFSYTPRALEGLTVPEFNIEDNLQDILTTLAERAPIQFFQINERYIAIQRADGKLISVCGHVIDTETGEPIANASISSERAKVGTDVDGLFRISGISEEATLSIFYAGILLKKIEASELKATGTECTTVPVSPNFNFLPEVVLNSYFTKGITRNATGSVGISNQNFDMLPNLIEPDILQIVQILPGIESADESASNINIRGGNSDETLLLWDDVRMYQSGHFFGLISAFNPNLTQRVTVYKNGTHPRYGENLSGVISMESEDEIPESISGGIGVNLISTNAYAKIPASETISFTLSGRTSINTGIGNPVYNEFFNRAFQNTVVTNLQSNTTQGLRSTDENFNFYDINVKALWDVSEKDKLRYSFLSIFNKLRFTELFIDETTSSSNISELRQDTQLNVLSWQRDWSPRLRTKVLYSTTEYGLGETNLEVNTGTTQQRQNAVSENNIKADVEYTLANGTLLTTGYQYTDTEAINAEASDATQAVSVRPRQLYLHALYAHAKIYLFERKSLITLGSRLSEYQGLGGWFWEPRANIHHKVTPSLHLNSAAERKVQGVYQFVDTENELLGVENRRWIVANGRDNKILKSEQVSVGATYSRTGWTLTAEGFLKKVEGISASNQGFRNQFENIAAIGSYTAKGLEVSVNKRFSQFNAWLSYTFMDNAYTFPELQPQTFPHRFNIQHSAQVAATYDYKRFSFSLGTHFRTGTPYTRPLSNNAITFEEGEPIIEYASPNAETVASYFRTDFSAQYSFVIDGTFEGALNLALLNILDRKNPLDTYFRVITDDEQNPTVNRVDQFSLGFTPNLSFQLLF